VRFGRADAYACINDVGGYGCKEYETIYTIQLTMKLARGGTTTRTTVSGILSPWWLQQFENDDERFLESESAILRNALDGYTVGGKRVFIVPGIRLSMKWTVF
jgi:hypothetical protein